jgi:hypothetical protein
MGPKKKENSKKEVVLAPARPSQIGGTPITIILSEQVVSSFNIDQSFLR